MKTFSLFGLMVFLFVTGTIAQAQEPFTLQPGRAGESYQQNIYQTLREAYKLRLESGTITPDFQWSIVTGQLPTGLELTPDGTIAGVPREFRNTPFPLRVRVTDLALRDAEPLEIEISIAVQSPKIRLVSSTAPRLVPIPPEPIVPVRINQPAPAVLTTPVPRRSNSLESPTPETEEQKTVRKLQISFFRQRTSGQQLTQNQSPTSPVASIFDGITRQSPFPYYTNTLQTFSVKVQEKADTSSDTTTGAPLPKKLVKFRILEGDAKFRTSSDAYEGTSDVMTNTEGIALADVKLGDHPGIVVIRADVVETDEAETDTIYSDTLYIVACDRSFFRYTMEFGTEFNRDEKNEFGNPFLYAGLTTNSYLGRGFHGQLDARVSSISQRENPMMEDGASRFGLIRRQAGGDELPGLFTSKTALEVGLSVFGDSFIPQKRSRIAGVEGSKDAPDRITFGPILKFQFRTPTSRDNRPFIGDLMNPTTEPLPKSLISEAFVGVRLAAYPKRYIDRCEGFQNGDCPFNQDNSVNKEDQNQKGKDKSPSFSDQFILTERNPLPLAYLNIMWGGSNHLINEKRTFVRDNQGNILFDSNQNALFSRGSFSGRMMLEGFLNIPRTPIGLRFNANIGPGRDEIRFGVFTRIDFARLGGAFSFLNAGGDSQ
ncbi:MAG: hypothetical protein HY774_24430 [Acidobacteria bacterium]|nr:hypothetical protein [Acidobacteriota bacterium]